MRPNRLLLGLFLLINNGLLFAVARAVTGLHNNMRLLTASAVIFPIGLSSSSVLDSVFSLGALCLANGDEWSEFAA